MKENLAKFFRTAEFVVPFALGGLDRLARNRRRRRNRAIFKVVAVGGVIALAGAALLKLSQRTRKVEPASTNHHDVAVRTADTDAALAST